jgi:hypothetical protein
MCHMLTILAHVEQPDELVLGQSIFARPTPWMVAWKAFGQFLRPPCMYRFAYVRPAMMSLAYNYISDGEFLSITGDDGQILRKTEILPMSWGLWWEYVVQSYLYGFFWRFWNWRLHSQDHVQEKLDGLLSQFEQRTKRITQED